MKLFQLTRQARRLALPKLPKAVLTCLISYSSKNGDGTRIYPGIATIALECSYSERSIQRALRYLEAAGWIIIHYAKGGQGKPSSYTLNLDEEGWLTAKPPAPREPEEMPATRRLNFARGILKRLAASSPAREKWEQEIRELEQILNEPPLEIPPAPVRNSPAIYTPARLQEKIASYRARAERLRAQADRWKDGDPTRDDFLAQAEEADRKADRLQQQHSLQIVEETPAQPILTDEEFNQLETAYFGSLAAQAREARASPAWEKWQPYIESLRDEYNKALQARGMVAVDGHWPPMDRELEEQIQENQRNQWNEAEEEERLKALVEARTRQRDSMEPGTFKYRMWNSLINQAQNSLKEVFQEGGT